MIGPRPRTDESAVSDARASWYKGGTSFVAETHACTCARTMHSKSALSKIMSPLNIPLGVSSGMSPNAATAIGLEPAACTPAGLYTTSAPNALDWDRRYMSTRGLGVSPDPFALSLDLSGASAEIHAFEYPAAAKHYMSFGGRPPMHELIAPGRAFEDTLSASRRRPAMDSLFSPLSPSKSNSDRQESHRESERRRRESMKSSLELLESMVSVTVSQSKSSPLNQKGRNKGSATRKLSHAETYRLAREMILALKSEIASHRSEVDRLSRGC
jgi:hypothetical protein